MHRTRMLLLVPAIAVTLGLVIASAASAADFDRGFHGFRGDLDHGRYGFGHGPSFGAPGMYWSNSPYYYGEPEYGLGTIGPYFSTPDYLFGPETVYDPFEPNYGYMPAFGYSGTYAYPYSYGYPYGLYGGLGFSTHHFDRDDWHHESRGFAERGPRAQIRFHGGGRAR